MSKRVLLGACTQNKLGATRHREKTCLDSAKETVVVVPRRKRFNSIQSYVTPLDAASEYAIGSIPGTLGIVRYQVVPWWAIYADPEYTNTSTRVSLRARIGNAQSQSQC